LYSFFNNQNSFFNNEPQRSQQDNDKDKDDDVFVIRKSIKGSDLGQLSTLLTDAFLKGRTTTNIVTYQWERLETYLSLEAGFPKPEAPHELFVACRRLRRQNNFQKDRVVLVGMAEVDGRMDVGRCQKGPYMCNVAVDPSFQRQGIASALVKECERQTHDWYREANAKWHPDANAAANAANSLTLKVRESNPAAVAMYTKLGYHCIREEIEQPKGGTVLVLRKDLLYTPTNDQLSMFTFTPVASLS
jgi:ribosomal protein S18 acetylase RimI-like enzyme